MALESYSESNFIGDEEKIIRMENEEITKEENEKTEEGDPCKKIWPILKDFFDEIPTYQNTKKLGDFNSETEKAIKKSDANIAEKKEKERTIDFPFVCEKIIIGYLYKMVNNKVKDNIKVEIQQASPYDDWMNGADAFLVVKKLNENKEELIKAIPIQITTAIVQDVLLEKMQQTKENEGILITVNAGNIRLLVNKYLEYYNSFIKEKEKKGKEKEEKKGKEKEEKKGKEKDNSMKDEPKSELLAPWDFFEFQDIVRNDDLEKIKKEGEEIIEQLSKGMKGKIVIKKAEITKQK